MTNIVGAAFLGVTVGCARCHDHKFDPIRQSDYYRLQAFFGDHVRAGSGQSHARRRSRVEGEGRARPSRDQSSSRADVPAARQEGPRVAGQAGAVDQADRRVAGETAGAAALYPQRRSRRTRSRDVHILARGEYTAKGDRVGMRPLGVLLPPGAPELPTTPRPRAPNWPSGSPIPTIR